MCNAKIARFTQRLEDRREEKKVVKPSTFLSWETDFPRKPLLFFSVCAKLFQLCFSVRCWSTQKKKQQKKTLVIHIASTHLFSTTSIRSYIIQCNSERRKKCQEILGKRSIFSVIFMETNVCQTKTASVSSL